MNDALLRLLDGLAPADVPALRGSPAVRVRDPQLLAVLQALDVGYVALADEYLVLTPDGQRALDGARAERLVTPG